MQSSIVVSIYVVLLFFVILCSAKECAVKKVPCEKIRNIAERSFPANQVDFMVCVASLVDYCPTAGKGNTVSVWSIPKQWVGREGCPSKIRDLTDPIIAARCAAQVLKAVGPDAWGSIGSKCKKQSPVCLGRHHSTGTEVTVAASGWGGPQEDVANKKRSNNDTASSGSAFSGYSPSTKSSGYGSSTQGFYSSYSYYSSSWSSSYSGNQWASTSTFGSSSSSTGSGSDCWWCWSAKRK